MRKTATCLAFATLLVGMLSASASAATILASPAGSISAIGSPYEISTSAGDISCTASFSGNLASSIPASSGASWGDFTGATLSGCVTTGTVLPPIFILISPVPRITVRQILGIPPAITGVLVTKTNVMISFTVLGVTCLYRGPVNYLAPFVRLLNGDLAVGRFAPLPGQTIPLIFGTAPPCPRVADVSRTGWAYGTLQKVTII
jgi:hypothetical protein